MILCATLCHSYYIIFQSNVNGKHEFKGKILALTPEKVFRYTSYSRITRQPDRDENYTVIEFKLVSPEVGKSEDKMTLRVTHSNLTAKASYEHSNFYWGGTLNIIKHLAEGEGSPKVGKTESPEVN